MNPHELSAHKILSLARLPVPTLPHIFSTDIMLSKWCNIVKCFFAKDNNVFSQKTIIKKENTNEKPFARRYVILL